MVDILNELKIDITELKNFYIAYLWLKYSAQVGDCESIKELKKHRIFKQEFIDYFAVIGLRQFDLDILTNIKRGRA